MREDPFASSVRGSDKEAKSERKSFVQMPNYYRALSTSSLSLFFFSSFTTVSSALSTASPTGTVCLLSTLLAAQSAALSHQCHGSDGAAGFWERDKEAAGVLKA